MTSSKKFVAVLMGSESDLSIMNNTLNILKMLHVNYEVRITSAHRTPHDTAQYIADADKRGCVIYIAAAGLAAHLAGCVAAHTVNPVIAVPITAGALNGLDALLSMVQMPAGVPVGCMGLDKHGAKNAGFYAAQIIALDDEQVRTALKKARANSQEKIEAQNKRLQDTVEAIT